MFVRLFDTVERLYVKKCIGDMFARAIVASLTRTKAAYTSALDFKIKSHYKLTFHLLFFVGAVGLASF